MVQPLEAVQMEEQVEMDGDGGIERMCRLVKILFPSPCPC